jgi:hypothetical protein
MITSLDVYGSAVVVGSYQEGVFYQTVDYLPDSGWINLGLDSVHVSAVYAHKSGPLGWGNTVGILPEGDDSNLIYCNFMDGEFFPNSLGFNDSLVEGIFSLAGFPDPTICGEKFAVTGPALYRQQFSDTVWTIVWAERLIEGAHLRVVKTKETFGGVVLAGGNDGLGGGLLLKSNDAFDTWEALTPPGPVMALEFQIDPQSGVLQTIFLSQGNQISRSPDGGTSWNIIYDGNWNYFNEIIFDSYFDLLFALGGDGLDSTSAILLYSTDQGNTWNQVSLNMAGPIIAADITPYYLYFATQWNGVYRIALQNLSVSNVGQPLSFHLSQNYPNPFNTSTRFKISIPREKQVRLAIYDLLGQEVAVLVDGVLTPGIREISWDASNVTSGIYFYRLVMGNTYITRKMIVLK